LRPGDKFNLHLGNCPEFLLFWMAAAKTGTVMVPTNPVSTAEEMAYILAHSEARLALTEPQYAAAVHAVAAHCPALGGVLEARPPGRRRGRARRARCPRGSRPPSLTPP